MAELDKNNKKYLVVFSYWNTGLNCRKIKNTIIPSSKIKGFSFTERWVDSINDYLASEWYDYATILNIIELNG